LATASAPRPEASGPFQAPIQCAYRGALVPPAAAAFAVVFATACAIASLSLRVSTPPSKTYALGGCTEVTATNSLSWCLAPRACGAPAVGGTGGGSSSCASSNAACGSIVADAAVERLA
jgi:hypothetical protein